MVDTWAMIRLACLLAGACILVGLTGCAEHPTPTLTARASVEERAPRGESSVPDACASLTAGDVKSAIARLPGWSYEVWSSSATIDGTPQPPGAHRSVEYAGPDRLRDVSWDARGARRGQIIIGDRYWVYTGFTLPAPFDPADFATWLERLVPFTGSFMEPEFAFAGELPRGGLRESPRVADNECLATDPSTGTSLVTTRSGQLVRITSERRSDGWIDSKALTFGATMPPPIEPPTAQDLRPKALFP